MYERSAIVLERYFDKIFGKNKENNLKTNYGNYTRIIEKLKEYQRIIEEEEKIIRKFDEVAVEMEKIQKEQSEIHESNLEMENERNKLFNDLGENPNTVWASDCNPPKLNGIGGFLIVSLIFTSVTVASAP